MSGATPLGIGIHPTLDSLMHRATSTSTSTRDTDPDPGAPTPPLDDAGEVEQALGQQLVLFTPPVQ